MTLSLDYSCRICLNGNSLLNIFLTKRSHNSAKVSCDEMMSEVFSLKVLKNDGLPNKICRKCFSKLSSAYKLRKLAEASHDTLSGYFSTSRTEGCRTPLKEEGGMGGKIKVEYLPKEEVGEDTLNDDSVFDDGMFVTDNAVKEEEDADPNYEDIAPKLSTIEKSTSITLHRKKHKNGKVAKGIGRPKGGTRLVCPLCGKQVADMDTHSETHKPPGEKRRLACRQCPKQFVSQSSLRRHVLVHHLGQLYFCQICNKSYKHGDQHVRMAHSSAPRPLGCALCDKRFFTAAQRDIHLTSHTKERAFPCAVCGKGFRTRTDSEIHRRSVHDKERSIMCQYCPKSFFSNADLRKHMCMHTNEKKFQCKECDKSFYRSHQLKLHAQRHAGLKTVVCGLCDKAFYTLGNLKIHMISHTKEKNFPCKYCGVKFGRTHHRDRHQKTAHEDKQPGPGPVPASPPEEMRSN